MMGMGRVGSDLMAGRTSPRISCGISEYIINEWNGAQDSMTAAYLCLREEYYSSSVSLACSATLCAARTALHVYGVHAEKPDAVGTMFDAHIVKPGLVEPKWKSEITRSNERGALADWDVTMVFGETDARESCERAQAFLDRIRILLGDALPAEDE